MRLLQSEINVVPGAKPNRQARPEGWVGDGAATLLIQNTTNLVNDYTIRVECDHPYWQPGWFRITALPPEGAPENQPPTGKPDQAGPKNQSLVMHINANGARKALLEFATPKSSEARAGVYHIRVVIESRVTDATVSSAPPHFTRIPATVIIRPFFEDWSCEFTPVDKKVTFFRRTARTELAITNRNNDWLYCELRPTKSQQVIPGTGIVRVAIPPPEPGRESIRSIPVTAYTKRRVFRSDPVTDPIPLSVMRVNAPSVPPLPEDWTTGAHAGLGASVLTAETKEERAAEEAGTITYYAPIRASLAGFMKSLVQNVKGIFFWLVGLSIVFIGARLAYEHATRKYNDVHISGVQNDLGEYVVDNGGSLVLTGSVIRNCTLDLTWQDHDKGVHTCRINTAGLKLKTTNEYRTQGAMEVPLVAQSGESPQNGTITSIRVYRPLWFFPEKVLPGLEIDKKILVGYMGMEVTANGPQGLSLAADDFGDEQGTWVVKGYDHALTLEGHWSRSHLLFAVAPDLADKKFQLTITRARDNATESVSVEPAKLDDMPPDATTPLPGDTGGGAEGAAGGGAPTSYGGSGGAPGSAGGTGGGGGGGEPAASASSPGYAALIKAIASDAPGDYRAARDALVDASTPQDKAYQAYVNAEFGNTSVAEGLDANDPNVIAASAKEAEMQRQSNAEALYRKASAHNGGELLPVLAYMSYLKRHGKSYGPEKSVAEHGLAKTPEEQQALQAFN